MLSQFNLTFVIKDEVLLITSRDKASTMLETRLFDVRDIVMVAGENPTATFEPLLDAVRMSVNPPSWDINGGPCTLMSFNSNGISGLLWLQTYHGQASREFARQLLRLKRPVAAAKPRPEMQFEHPAPGQTQIQIPQRSETPPETPPQSSNRQ